MAVPDLSQVTAGLAKAREAVAEAKTKVPADAAPHLDEVDAQLQAAQTKVEEALASASEQSGGQV